jgi:non-homologous end joining protein Ku
VLIRPMGDGLLMEQLKHLEELRPFSEVPLDTCSVDPGELKLAIQIIEQRANEHFEPEKYTDEIRSRISKTFRHLPAFSGRFRYAVGEERPDAKIID